MMRPARERVKTAKRGWAKWSDIWWRTGTPTGKKEDRKEKAKEEIQNKLRCKAVKPGDGITEELPGPSDRVVVR